MYIPVKNLVGMAPNTTTALMLYFRSVQNMNANESANQNVVQNDVVTLNVTAGQHLQVMRAICRAVTSNKLYGDGKIVVADDASVALDNSAMTPVYLHPGITSVGNIDVQGMADAG